MSKATAYWDRVSRIYEKMFQKFAPYEEVYRFIKENLTSEMNVLEVGTATGLVARQIAESVKTVVATDISEKMIEQAKNIKHPENVTFSCANIFELPFEDNSFDAVVASNVLHIIPEPEKALQEIKRVLKTDGLLIAPTFLWKNTTLKGKFQKFFMLLSGIPVHSQWSDTTYPDFITSNKFEIVNSKIVKYSFLIYCVVGKSK